MSLKKFLGSNLHFKCFIRKKKPETKTLHLNLKSLVKEDQFKT